MPAIAQSKQIAELTPYLESSANIRQHAIPTQFATENFRIFISQIYAGMQKSDVGLGSVDDTSDEQKPLSALMRQALNTKATSDHNHTVSSVTGLEELLAGMISKNDNEFLRLKISELLPESVVIETSSNW